MCKYLNRYVLLIFVMQVLYVQAAEQSHFSKPALNNFDQQRPGTINDNKWLALKAAAQDIKLLPTPSGIGALQSFFGGSISIDNNRALVGAPGFNRHGVVYVLEFMGGNWQQTAVLIAGDFAEFNSFGISVSLDGDRALIGTNGAFYIFDLENGIWSRSLIGSRGDSSGFGSAVSLLNNLAVIGANLDDENGENAGAVYIYEFNFQNWSLIEKLMPIDGREGDKFGSSISLSVSGFKALIGAPLDDDNGIDAGAAYVFNVGKGFASQEAKITTSLFGEGDRFGTSVSLNGNQALIGANGDDDMGTQAGAAYLFQYDSFNDNWFQLSKLKAFDGATGDLFGTSVSLSADRALISAIFDNDNGTDSGSAYVFELNGLS